MAASRARRLEDLRAEFAELTGTPFAHFFCPILHVDEPGELCDGHVVNEAFAGSSKARVPQRKDVDSFFGTLVESDFVLLQHRDSHDLIDVLADRRLSRQLRPALLLNGRKVPFYRPGGPIPTLHSPLLVSRGPQKSIILAVKVSPDELSTIPDARWEIFIEKDLRLRAQVSLVKAAHLTMFALFGYRYALTYGGRFIGYDLLGRYYRMAHLLRRPDAIRLAESHFQPFRNLVRPIVPGSSRLDGTVSDGVVFYCPGERGPWATIVVIRTGKHAHAVLLPSLDSETHVERFERFVNEPSSLIDVRLMVHRHDRWELDTSVRKFAWPSVEAA